MAITIFSLECMQAGALKPRLQHWFQEWINYKIMTKNDHLYWRKMAWATASYAFWLLHIIHKVFQQNFLFN